MGILYFFNSMSEFQTISEVVDTSIRNSSYISVLISSGVFITYTLINKVIELFKSKNKNKPLIEMAEAIKDVSINIVKLNSALDKVFKDSEHKELITIKTLIQLCFASFKNHISQECIDMIIKNHIETNEALIKENIVKLVSTEFYKIHSILINYNYNNSNLAAKLDKDWIKETTDDVLTIMYNGQDAATRIAQLNSRLDMNVNNYSIHLNNKIFN